MIQNSAIASRARFFAKLSQDNLKVAQEYSSDFSDADSFVEGNNVTVTGGETIGGETNCLKIVDTVDNSTHYATRPTTITDGQLINVQFDYYIPSSNVNIDGIYVELGSGANTLLNTSPVTDQWHSLKMTLVFDESNDRIDIYTKDGGISYAGNGTDYIGIKNFVISEVDKVADQINENHGTLNGVFPALGKADPAARNYYEFDGDSGDGMISDEAKIQNIFDNGGYVGAWVYPRSDGENNEGSIIYKWGSGWLIQVSSESAGFLKIFFWKDFSGTNGKWKTSSAVLPIDSWTHIGLEYDSTDVVNNPVITLTTLAGVVSTPAITENQSPVGTRTADVGVDLHIGNSGGDDRTFDGFIIGVKLFNYIPDSADLTFYSDILNHLKYADIGGSSTELIATQANRDFSGANNWNNGNFDSYNDSGDLSVTATAGGQFCSIAATYVPTVAGKQYRLTGELANRISTFTIKNYANNNTYGTITTNGVFSLEFTATDAGGILLIANTSSSSGDFDNFSLTQIGVVLNLDPAGMEHETGYWSDFYNDIHAAMTNVVFNRNLNSYPKAMLMDFDDSGKYIQLTSAYTFAANHTVAIMVYISGAESYGYPSLFGNKTTFSYVRLKAGIELTDMHGETDTNADNIDFSGLGLTDNAWNLIVITQDNSLTWRCYINGVYKDSDTTTDSELTIGYIGAGHNTNYWNGLIGYFAIWDECKDKEFAKLLADSLI